MNKFYNGIIGLVVGDALGVPVEFKKRDTYKITDMTGYGTYNQPPGTWSDDSSLTLATLESMMRLGKIDLNDIMDNGNGALMRILPVAMMPHNSQKESELLSVAHLTHAHFISDYGCLIYAAIVENLMNGMNKEEAVFRGVQRFQNSSMPAEYSRLPNVQSLRRDEIRSSGYVVDTLEAALWCFLNTNTYRDCVLAAVNLGEDTDTIAAIAGGLAGIYYGCGGESGIPDEWIAQIPRRVWIECLCAEMIIED